MPVLIGRCQFMVDVLCHRKRRQHQQEQHQTARKPEPTDLPEDRDVLRPFHRGEFSTIATDYCQSTHRRRTVSSPRSPGRVSITTAMLIDTHMHLDDARYDGDREAMIARAREAGVETFITIGCDLTTSHAAVALAEQYPFVYATIGVHPHEVKYIADGWYDELHRLATHRKVVAYGEIGLDYHYHYSPPNEQRTRFREQIGLARELKLPIVIHTREAQEDTIAILREENASEVGGVFHCFSGDAWLAKHALDLGFYLSFSGILTFQNAAMLREIAKTVPIDRLLIETDCPYLTPMPHRGKRNEPAYVRLVAERLAELKSVEVPLSVEDIGRITTDNARRLFKIS